MQYCFLLRSRHRSATVLLLGGKRPSSCLIPLPLLPLRATTSHALTLVSKSRYTRTSPSPPSHHPLVCLPAEAYSICPAIADVFRALPLSHLAPSAPSPRIAAPLLASLFASLLPAHVMSFCHLAEGRLAVFCLSCTLARLKSIVHMARDSRAPLQTRLRRPKWGLLTSQPQHLPPCSPLPLVAK